MGTREEKAPLTFVPMQTSRKRKVFLAEALFKPSQGSVSFNRNEMKALAFCMSI